MTVVVLPAKGPDMTRTPVLIALAAAAALAGCNKQDQSAAAANDSANAATNAPVALPPSIVATKIYRCADNTLVTVDYLSDGKSANVRVGEGAAPVLVTTAEPGKPMTAEGYSVEGTAESGSATIAVPGHASQSCKA